MLFSTWGSVWVMVFKFVFHLNIGEVSGFDSGDSNRQVEGTHVCLLQHFSYVPEFHSSWVYPGKDINTMV